MGIKELAKRKEWGLNFARIDQKIQKKLKKDGRQKFVASYFILTANSYIREFRMDSQTGILS